MFTTEDKTIAPTIDANFNGGIGISASDTSAGSIASTTTSHPVANMDETDWATMLMEMRILSA